MVSRRAGRTLLFGALKLPHDDLFYIHALHTGPPLNSASWTRPRFGFLVTYHPDTTIYHRLNGLSVCQTGKFSSAFEV